MSADIKTLLSLPADADRKAVDKAYRQRVRKLHPDTNPSPEAADELADLNSSYAQFQTDLKNGVRPPHHVASDPGGGAPPVQISVHPSTSSMRGAGIYVIVRIPTPLEAPQEHSWTAEHQMGCRACRGTGRSPHGPRKACGLCQALGMDAKGTSCPDCAGIGSLGELPCNDCGGARTVLYRHKVDVTLPVGAGAGTGTRHMFQSCGMPSARRGLAGDLVVDVLADSPSASPAPSKTVPEDAVESAQDVPTVAPAPNEPHTDSAADPFVRHEGGVGLAIPFTYAELRTGTTITIPSPAGPTEFLLPPGCVPGTVQVLEGHGDPTPDGTRGPLHVRCDLHWPGPARPEEVTALDRLQEAETIGVPHPRQHLTGAVPTPTP